VKVEFRLAPMIRRFWSPLSTLGDRSQFSFLEIEKKSLHEDLVGRGISLALSKIHPPLSKTKKDAVFESQR